MVGGRGSMAGGRGSMVEGRGSTAGGRGSTAGSLKEEDARVSRGPREGGPYLHETFGVISCPLLESLALVKVAKAGKRWYHRNPGKDNVYNKLINDSAICTHRRSISAIICFA
jgi:hypothetical protein